MYPKPTSFVVVLLKLLEVISHINLIVAVVLFWGCSFNSLWDLLLTVPHVGVVPRSLSYSLKRCQGEAPNAMHPRNIEQVTWGELNDCIQQKAAR